MVMTVQGEEATSGRSTGPNDQLKGDVTATELNPDSVPLHFVEKDGRMWSRSCGERIKPMTL
jgi:hypothetical protein